MAIASRLTTTTWEGDLPSGKGTLSQSSSSVLDNQVVTCGSRTRAPEGKTSPEELLAAAHSSCFAMAFNDRLSQDKIVPNRLEVTAEVTLDEVDGNPTITTSKITLKADIDGITEEAFRAAVSDAESGCPVSRLYASAEITVNAELV